VAKDGGDFETLTTIPLNVQSETEWLVSPELSGNAQTVSFFARHAALGPEQFQLYISTSGLETTNFMAFDTAPRNTNAEWTKYEYALPQGTKYFAVRKVTDTDPSWAMLVDDVTFAPDTLAAQTGLTLYGYHIYRNGERVNRALVNSPAFSDPDGKAGDIYRVTAVYNQGESVYSEAAAAGDDTGGINSVYTDMPEGVVVYNLAGQRVVTARKGALHYQRQKARCEIISVLIKRWRQALWHAAIFFVF